VTPSSAVASSFPKISARQTLAAKTPFVLQDSTEPNANDQFALAHLATLEMPSQTASEVNANLTKSAQTVVPASITNVLTLALENVPVTPIAKLNAILLCALALMAMPEMPLSHAVNQESSL
jgi:hypothetical protein